MVIYLKCHMCPCYEPLVAQIQFVQILLYCINLVFIEIIQHAVEDYSYVSEWYLEESAVLDETFSNQLIQFLLDVQEIQFHLPSHGHDLDSHWPTQTTNYDAIMVNGGVLRIQTNDTPERPNTPIAKFGTPTHSKR